MFFSSGWLGGVQARLVNARPNTPSPPWQETGERRQRKRKKKKKNTTPRRCGHGETKLVHLLRCRFDAALYDKRTFKGTLCRGTAAKEKKTIFHYLTYMYFLIRSSCAVLGFLCVSTPVSKDTTLAISIPMTLRSLYSTSRGCKQPIQSCTNEDTGCVLVISIWDAKSTYLQFSNCLNHFTFHDLFQHSVRPTQHFLFSQGLICSKLKVLMLTANSLKTSSTEQPCQVCVPLPFPREHDQIDCFHLLGTFDSNYVQIRRGSLGIRAVSDERRRCTFPAKTCRGAPGRFVSRSW